jgi:hypothetical protein
MYKLLKLQLQLLQLQLQVTHLANSREHKSHTTLLQLYHRHELLPLLLHMSLARALNLGLAPWFQPPICPMSFVEPLCNYTLHSGVLLCPSCILSWILLQEAFWFFSVAHISKCKDLDLCACWGSGAGPARGFGLLSPDLGFGSVLPTRPESQQPMSSCHAAACWSKMDLLSSCPWWS